MKNKKDNNKKKSKFEDPNLIEKAKANSKKAKEILHLDKPNSPNLQGTKFK